MPEQYLTALDNFTDFIVQREGRIEERDKKRKMSVLSTNFINQLQGAQTEDEVSEITLRGNKLAAAVGIPELANLINNYSNIKANQISGLEQADREQDMLSAVAEQYGDIEAFIIRDGKTVVGQLKDLDEFKKALLADPKIASDLIRDIAKNNALDTKYSIRSTDRGYGTTVEKFNKEGKGIVVAQYSPYVTDEGKVLYDDDLTLDDPTTDEIENLEGEEAPGVLTEFLAKRDLQRESTDRQLRQQIPRIAVDFDGNKRDVIAVNGRWVYSDDGKPMENLNYFQGMGKAYDIFAPTAGEKTVFNLAQKPSTDLANKLINYVDVNKNTGALGIDVLGVDPDIIKDIEDSLFPHLFDAKVSTADKKVKLVDLVPIYDKLVAKQLATETGGPELNKAELDFVDRFGFDIATYKNIANKPFTKIPGETNFNADEHLKGN